MRLTRFAFPLFAIVLLGACDYFGGATADDASGDASGEVLPGSISDAMIPTDDLTSSPPALVVPPSEGGTPADAAADSGAASADSAVVEPAQEAPAEPEAAAE
ncbi:MAG: hypothetical protein ABIT10_14245 [Alteraurantiacibacter sp.]